MKSKLDNFFKKNETKTKKIILSLDLDNTLVNRSMGSNYVDKRILDVLYALLKKNVIILPNTGRDLVGFSAFQRDALNLNNAVLGSGSVILVDGKKFFNKKSEIDHKLIKYLFDSVFKKNIDFIDLSSYSGRDLIFGTKKHRELYFSQNPRDWFDKKLPTIHNVNQVNETKFRRVFRVEFPVFKNDNKILYRHLINKSNKAINIFSDFVGRKLENDYAIKRKLYFSNSMQGEVLFARLEKNTNYVNKSAGLRNWLTKKKLYRGIFVVHVGDKDSGLINDTIIKQELPSALVVMVGNKCRLDNPLVDLYLRGNVDDELYLFLEMLLKSVTD